MKAFISWSGELSRAFGEEIRNWLPSALQSVRPYFTPNDIEKGARWGNNIAAELKESKVGVFCLTRENLESPWIMFEAGAISKIVGDACVCPILFDLEPSDISGPLSQFQLTQFNKNDMSKLFSSINSQCGENSLDKDTESQVFEMWWPKLEERIGQVLEEHKDTKKEEIRSDREILEEILHLSRFSAKQAKKSESNDSIAVDLDYLNALDLIPGMRATSGFMRKYQEFGKKLELEKINRLLDEGVKSKNDDKES